MEPLQIFLGNKNYSSWSMRPWLLMRHAGIPFEEIVIPLDYDGPDAARHPQIRDVSPSGRVPVLRHGQIVVWESLSIMEYLADVFPEKRLWPRYMGKRAKARSIAHEMHAGFAALRRECPCNLRRKIAAIPVSEACRRDIDRISTIWRDCRRQYEGTGPFLFGNFSIADAMYAPVVNRFEIYALSEDPEIRQYMNTILDLPAYQEWKAAAAREEWVIESEEI